MRYLLVGLMIVLGASQAFAAKAFPGAEGFGTETRGAYGLYAQTGNASDLPTIYKVTTLADSGAGSFRAAAEAARPRIIVFQTGGLITLSTPIFVAHPYVTIAGQTAPGDGIALRGAPLFVRSTATVTAHDIVVRGIRSRPTNIRSFGWSDYLNRDCFGVVGYHGNALLNKPYNVVFDHNSCSWSTDESMQVWYGGHNLTFSNNLFFEPVRTAERPEHHFGPLIGPGTTNISYHHNIVATAYYRSPLVGGGGDPDDSMLAAPTSIEIINNINYNGRNWGDLSISRNSAYSGSQPQRIALIGDYHKRGPSTNGSPGDYTFSATPVDLSSQIYLSGNLTARRYDHSFAENHVFDPSALSSTSTLVSSLPFTLSGVTVTEASQNFARLTGMDGDIPRAGAYPRDIVDTIMMEEVTSGSAFLGTVGPTNYTYGPSDATTTSNWRNNRTMFPAYSAGAPWTDSDNDGMDDAWELATFGDLSQTAHGDFNGNGYTNIEDYINSFFSTGSTPTTTYTLQITPTNTGSGDGIISSSPSGIYCGPQASCSAAFAENTVVTLLQEPYTGDVFIQWTGACAGQGSTCTLTMDGNKSASALFNIAGDSSDPRPRPPVGLRLVPRP